MSLFGGPIAAKDAQHEAAQQLESLLTQKLLEASGAFKGTGEAGSSMSSGLFASTLADAVARSGGIGLANELESQLSQGVGNKSVKDVTHALIAHTAPAEEQGGKT